MKLSAHRVALVLLIGLGLASIGCPKKKAEPPKNPTPAPAPQQPAQDVTPPQTYEPPTPPPPVDDPMAHTLMDIQNKYFADAFFDFDKYDLRSDARDALAKDADFMKAHATLRITIEGHCDERGTREYNLALGEKRANAAKDYLVALGVDAGRVSVVSYGKDRPFAMGHDEDSWAKNRRAHMVVTAK